MFPITVAMRRTSQLDRSDSRQADVNATAASPV